MEVRSKAGSRAFVFLTIAASFSPLPAHAARLVVALDETVDEKASTASETEIALLEALQKDDRWVFVDAEQSRKVRKAARSKSLLDTDVADLVTSLTADILVVGRVELTAVDPGPFKELSVYRGTAQNRGRPPTLSGVAPRDQRPRR